MAAPFDTVGRLAEGRPFVDDLAEYVLACRRLGFQHPDLTAHASQVHDWYGGEAGLDLRALDADCAALAEAATVAEDAARTHTDLAVRVGGAWSGRGATSAREFAGRSGQSATAVGSAVRRTADAMAALRTEIWRAVDAKVTAVDAIDARHRAQRDDWLAAARTVTTGTGDVASASELVDQQIRPFVANDVSSEWLGAMRAATAAINAAYDAAIASTSSGPLAVFDVPGELGPRVDVPGPAAAPANPSPGQTVPAAAVAGTPAAPWSGAAPLGAGTPMAPAGVPPVGEPPPAVVPAASAPPMSPMPSSGEIGAGTSSLGTGLSGFGQQLADLIGGLVGSADGAGDVAGIGEPADESDDEPLEDAADGSDEEDGEPSTEDDPEADEPAEEPAEEATAEPTPESSPEPTPVPPPPPPSPEPPPATPESAVETAGPTPCEIAADEVPQVGE